MRALARRLLTVLVVSVAVGACSPEPSAQSSQSAPHALDWGVFVPDDQAGSSDLAVVTDMAGATPGYVLRFAAINDQVPLGALSAITAGGAVPILTLELWQPGAGPEQPAYSLRRILAGDFDSRLEAWARILADWGSPLILRTGHEMNSTFYPWSVRVNGNTAVESAAAWRHVREIFRRAGADNVAFMWCPDASADGLGDMAAAFPGADSIDVLGLDGYNWGEGDGRSWRSAAEIFGDSLAQLRRLDPRHDIVIAETAGVEGPRSGIDKADWIYGLFDYLATQDRVTGVVWFQAVKERDWRFNSSPQAQEAFRQSVAKHSGR
ncbi:glycoside hydrolase family 26 protein [Mycobacterium sp. PS03-16]|uniref:glycoside hydrolase family 26 protein n=1 Tax=Mycobacterium sp. PS03-16 TaxID=2559611 RepID=UPI001430DD5E|nr:glycosyl hydrolase [Mycobacterium sp. PS03-16]